MEIDSRSSSECCTMGRQVKHDQGYRRQQLYNTSEFIHRLALPLVARAT